jgi:hypothetical protein
VANVTERTLSLAMRRTEKQLGMLGKKMYLKTVIGNQTMLMQSELQYFMIKVKLKNILGRPIKRLAE